MEGDRENREILEDFRKVRTFYVCVCMCVSENECMYRNLQYRYPGSNSLYEVFMSPTV